MKRYSIMVIEYGADREIELCQTDTNPQMVVEAAKEKTLKVYKGPEARRRSTICKYLVQVDVTATTGNTVPNQVAAGLAAIARTAIVDTNINLFGGNFGAVVQAGGQITNTAASGLSITKNPPRKSDRRRIGG